MRHYAKMNGYEEDMLNPRYRRCFCYKAESLAETKAIYRRRERAALKRATAELVAEELDRWHNADYWERELAEQLVELQYLEAEEERDREFAEIYDCWEHYDQKFYRNEYKRLFERIDEVYGELAMVA